MRLEHEFSDREEKNISDFGRAGGQGRQTSQIKKFLKRRGSEEGIRSPTVPLSRLKTLPMAEWIDDYDLAEWEKSSIQSHVVQEGTRKCTEVLLTCLNKAPKRPDR